MKNYILTSIIALISFFSFAQGPAGAGGNSAPNFNRGHIFGKVVDEQGKPVEFASVVLLKTVLDPATKQNLSLIHI